VREWLPARLPERGRFLLALAPNVILFAVVEWALSAGTIRFAEMFWIFAATVPLVTGIFPMLLVAASRRNGDIVPGAFLRFMGNPLIVWGTYLLFLVGVLAHGFLIWSDPVQRITALAVGAAMIAITVLVIRRGALKRMTVVEIREDASEGGQTTLSIVSGGKPAPISVEVETAEGKKKVTASRADLPAFASLRKLTVDLPDSLAASARVWAHRVTLEGNSEPLPAFVVADRAGAEPASYDLQQSAGRVVFPTGGAFTRVSVTAQAEAGKIPGKRK
jgi:hypothetical protein